MSGPASKHASWPVRMKTPDPTKARSTEERQRQSGFSLDLGEQRPGLDAVGGAGGHAVAQPQHGGRESAAVPAPICAPRRRSSGEIEAAGGGGGADEQRGAGRHQMAAAEGVGALEGGGGGSSEGESLPCGGWWVWERESGSGEGCAVG
jgi:hypothetical protein